MTEATQSPDTAVAAVTGSAENPVTEKRKPLLFEPEPAQRMVVVRRRGRRRSKKVNKTEQVEARVRLVLFGLVIILLLVAVSGQHFDQSLLEQLKDIARPLKNVLLIPTLEVIALVIAALILFYMMPGVESTIKRWLGITNRPKQKSR
jgi:cytochrome b subunit of formate dehydrogenase